MPRPGRNIEQVLLRSGRALYPERGSAGLSVRSLAEHAGLNVGMFHYHFRSKDDFLRELLQQYYEEMFGPLSERVHHEGPPLQRLRDALACVTPFVASHSR